MKDHAVPDARQKAILQSAWTAFAAYGFRKTSMDDIARGAGLSRPALYLHYRNKEDIFRSLAQVYFDVATDGFEAALARPGPVGEVLGEAFLAKSGEIVETMLTSPHGHELLDTKHASAADIVEAGEARLAAILEDWLEAQAGAGRVRLPAPAEEVARLCLSSINALIHSAQGHDAFVRGVRTFGRLLGDGLAAR